MGRLGLIPLNIQQLSGILVGELLRVHASCKTKKRNQCYGLSPVWSKCKQNSGYGMVSENVHTVHPQKGLEIPGGGGSQPK